ncbi:MAG: hypothetical protein GPJ50_03865 [Candidatus Heimdallarchaeota archaeon]|nr:hypothetical protein [Candidatus Heimdallarchaeota archaeon]
MKKRLEEIERKILSLFNELRKDIPALHHMDFEVTKYNNSSITRVHGFIHTSEVGSYYSIAELITIISEAKVKAKKEEILFQKFDKIL